MNYGFELSKGTPEETLRLAQEAENAGWDGVFTWDAISVGPWDVFDPWVMMGAIAGVTERVKIGAMIFRTGNGRVGAIIREVKLAPVLEQFSRKNLFPSPPRSGYESS